MSNITKDTEEDLLKIVKALTDANDINNYFVLRDKVHKATIALLEELSALMEYYTDARFVERDKALVEALRCFVKPVVTLKKVAD